MPGISQTTQSKNIFFTDLFDHSSLDSLLDPGQYPEDDLGKQSGTEGVSIS